MKNEPGEFIERGGAPPLSVMLALLLAFLPAALVLVMSGFVKGKDVPSVILLGECVFCLACCAISSFLLYRRKTIWAISAAVLLMAWNRAISFFFGCTAMLAGFH
jgi:hypothetical protein